VAKSGEEATAQSLIPELETEFEVNRFVGIFVQRRWKAAAEACFVRLLMLQHEPTVETMEHVMELFRGDVGAVLQLLADVRESVKVNKVVYLRLLEAVKGRRRASAIVKEMETRYGFVSEQAFGFILTKCGDEGDVAAAEDVLRAYQKYDFRVRGVNYHDLYRAYLKSGFQGSRAAAKATSRLARLGLLTPRTIVEAAKIHIEKGEAQLVEAVALTEREVLPHAAPVLIDAYSQLSRPEKAERLVKRIENSGQPVTVEMYNSLIDCLSFNGNTYGFKEAYSRLRQSPTAEPNAQTFLNLIEAFRRVGDLNGCEAAVQSMLAHGLEPRIGVYNRLLKSYSEAHDNEGFERCLKTMHYRGIEYTHGTYGIVVDTLTKFRMYDKGEKWFDLMVRRGVQPNAVVCTNLMRLRIADNRLHEAVDVLLKVMPTLGVKPDEVAYRTIIGALRRADRQDEAEYIANLARSHGFQIYLHKDRRKRTKR